MYRDTKTEYDTKHRCLHLHKNLWKTKIENFDVNKIFNFTFPTSRPLMWLVYKVPRKDSPNASRVDFIFKLVPGRSLRTEAYFFLITFHFTSNFELPQKHACPGVGGGQGLIVRLMCLQTLKNCCSAVLQKIIHLNIVKRFLVFGKQTYTSETAAIIFKTFRSITHQENTWTTRYKDSTQIYTGWTFTQIYTGWTCCPCKCVSWWVMDGKDLKTIAAASLVWYLCDTDLQWARSFQW